MRYGSVCSGIEAASVAWEPLGWRASFLSEIEPFPRSVLAHRFPGVPLHGDFTTIQEGQYAAIDLLVGGTPCQSFSVAGLRGGLADERGNLALEYLRLAQRLRPRWVVWENVPGVLSSGGGRDFGAFLGGLGELGYGWAYRVLDAQYFGLAQRRRRVFVVGCAGGAWQRAAAVLFERASLSGHPAPRRDARKDAAASAGSSAARGGVAQTLTTGTGGRYDPETETLIAHTLRGEGHDASEDGTGRGVPVIPFDLTQITSATNRSRAEPGMPAPTLHRGGGAHLAFNARQDPGHDVISLGAKDTGHGVLSVAIRGRDGGGTAEVGDDLAHALRASQGGGDKAHAMTEHGVRRLTPVECERLQGFPDGWTDVPYRGRPAADGPRYKAIGNSMAVPVMAWIGRRIQAVEDLSVSNNNAPKGAGGER